jgi:hypothetical protein
MDFQLIKILYKFVYQPIESKIFGSELYVILFFAYLYR